MSPRHLKWIAGTLAALLLVWGASELFSRGSDSVKASLALPALSPADVDSITLVKGTDSVVLTKQASTQWTVNGHRAAPASVTDLFQALKDTTRPDVVAEDTSSFARLQVDSGGGRWVRVFRGGKSVVALIVGARGTDYQSAYLRRPGSARVFLWRGALATLADRRADDWRDKQIAALESDSVGALEVERGKDRYTLAKSGKTWHVNGAAADSTAVVRLLEHLKTITASGFATPREVDSTKALRPTRRVVVRGGPGGPGGRGVLLSLAFDSTASSWIVRHVAGVGGEGATVYRMNVWDVDGLTPTSQSIKPAKPTPPAAGPTRPPAPDSAKHAKKP
ncbi:MAG TPA: DUF4340 domain-containing protein [Candidatus Dormibacteraeota bacterium]|nr:DUF4340 domain-containing protein [Candidatus Dormibacteraeota bacterium]